MNEKQIAAAFNEWMRRYIENPAEFEREFQAVVEYQRQTNHRVEPDYGHECAAYLHKLHVELQARG